MLAAVGVITLAVLAGAVALWPRGELPRSAAGQADPTRLVPATLTRVARVACEDAEPGVAGSICIKVTARLPGGRQVAFATTDPTGARTEVEHGLYATGTEPLRILLIFGTSAPGVP